jgi:hypothetical protein
MGEERDQKDIDPDIWQIVPCRVVKMTQSRMLAVRKENGASEVVWIINERRKVHAEDQRDQSR